MNSLRVATFAFGNSVRLSFEGGPVGVGLATFLITNEKRLRGCSLKRSPFARDGDRAER